VIVELLPLSWLELLQAGRFTNGISMQAVCQQIWRGFFPGVQNCATAEEVLAWMSSYLMSVAERDIRALMAIADLGRFQKFLELLALRAGQVLNLSEVAKEAQISHAAARSWLSVLEATYVIKLLQPWQANLSKRAIKSPKLLFVDTGLLCYLLRIRSPEELGRHPLYGNIFENMVAIEMIKRLSAAHLDRSIYFYRQESGAEIDLLVETAEGCWAYEVKSTLSPSTEDRRHLVALKDELRIRHAQVLSLANAPLGQNVQSRHFVRMDLPE
jgi:predicted AAA+ superfamily ATPase